MSEHTPGPWVAVGSSVRTQACGHPTEAPNAYGGGVCNCLGDSMRGKGNQINQTARAKARLIAAAPDMLDLLKMIDEYFGNPPDDNVAQTRMVMDIAFRVSSIVAKAKGEKHAL